MIDIGVVESVDVVAGKSIVAVRLEVDLDKVPLEAGAVSIKFSNQVHANKLSGHKWWPERQQIDLLFDSIEVLPQLGDAVFVSLDGQALWHLSAS